MTYGDAMAQQILELKAELSKTRGMLRRRDRRIETLTKPRSLHCVSCTKRQS